MDFKQLMNSEEYDFLRTNERFGNRIMLLGLGGSYAYGTNNDNSDIDFRGVTLQMPSDLLGLTEVQKEEYRAGTTCSSLLSMRLPERPASMRDRYWDFVEFEGGGGSYMDFDDEESDVEEYEEEW